MTNLRRFDLAYVRANCNSFGKHFSKIVIVKDNFQCKTFTH